MHTTSLPWGPCLYFVVYILCWIGEGACSNATRCGIRDLNRSGAVIRSWATLPFLKRDEACEGRLGVGGDRAACPKPARDLL